MSDRDRLLDLLERRGSAGVTTFEIRRMGLSGNPSQRRNELLDRGYLIDALPFSEGRRRGKRYVLRSEPAEVPTVTAARTDGGDLSESEDALFDLEPEGPISAITGKRAAA